MPGDFPELVLAPVPAWAFAADSVADEATLALPDAQADTTASPDSVSDRAITIVAEVAQVLGDEDGPPPLPGVGTVSAIDLARRIARVAGKGQRPEPGASPPKIPDVAKPTLWTLQSDADAVDSVLILAGQPPGEPGTPRSSAAPERAHGALVGRAIADSGPVVCLATAGFSPAELGQFAEALLLAAYRYDPKRAVDARTLAGPGPRRSTAEPVVLTVSARTGARAWDRFESELARAERRARAVWVARDLANTPSSVKSPAWLADQAERLAAGAGLKARTTDAAELVSRGFGGMLAVGSGSDREPVMVTIEYAPEGGPQGASSGHVVLVGKGITFDTGGLDLKPLLGMPLMKTDMAGSAAVLGAMLLIAAERPAVRVTALLMVAENSISGSAYRPGDVITHYGGRTSEVTNTDAEGRLVLADGLAHAVRDLKPTAVLDIATLTGAATLGLGRQHAAGFSNDVRLGARLLAAGESSGDAVWLMPLAEEYVPMIRSTIADARNAVTGSADAGSITAALFLQEFVGDVPWVHLDIAGPGRAESDLPEAAKGATGFGVRVIADWVESGARPGGRQPAGRRQSAART